MIRQAHLPSGALSRGHLPRASAGRKSSFTSAIYIYWLALAAATQLIYLAGLLGDRFVFKVFTVILVGYMSHEIWSYVRFNKERWVSPVVVASIVMFIIPFGISNLTYMIPARYAQALTELLMSGLDYSDMNRAMFLAVVGGIAMWWGYRSRVGVRAGNSVKRAVLASGLITRSFRPNTAFVAACIILSVLARLWMVKLGIFGYSSDVTQLRLTSGFNQYLKMVEKMGLLALAILAIAHYATGGKRVGLVFRCVLINEVVWGVLSGFKFSVILPFVIMMAIKFMVTRRISKNTIIITAVALVGAYYIVEPFRYLRNSSQDFNNRDIGSITETFLLATGSEEGRVGGVEFGQSLATTIPVAILFRTNLTVFAAKAVQHDERGLPSENTPHFLENIMLAPAYAFVPRFIWTTKAQSTSGSWFSVEVMGWSATTATAMSTVAYLNYAGGIVAVVLGFILLGVVQRSVYQGFYMHISGCLLMYLLLLNATAFLDSEYWTFIVNFIRLVPMALFIQRFAFEYR